MDFLTDVLMTLAMSAWVYPLVAGLSMIDALIPPVPSETIVIGAASLGAATGAPNMILLAVCAALGAFAGDTLTYLLGRRLGTTRFAWMRTPRARKAIDSAASGLERGGASAIFIARYIPVGRVAVNLTAGATGFSSRRFVPLSLAACATWAAYSVGIGLVAGSVLGDHPVLSVVLGVAVALIVGLIIDRARALLIHRREARQVPSSTPAKNSTGTHPTVVRKMTSRTSV